MDFLGKNLLDTFYYTDMFMNREGVKEMKVNGRTYARLGTYQAVTMVGNLYEYYDPIVEHHKKMVMVGIAKQHPCDLSITKEEGFEAANERAFVDPCLVMEVDDCFGKEQFMMMCEAYSQFAIRRAFVYTPAEIRKKHRILENGER